MDQKCSVSHYIDNSRILCKNGYKPAIPLSALTGRGVIDIIWSIKNTLYELNYMPKSPTLNSPESIPSHSLETIDEYYIAPPKKGDNNRSFIVSGVGIEKFTEITRFEDYYSIKRLHYVLDLAGVFESLIKTGIRNGDTILIDKIEMKWDEIVWRTKSFRAR